jgi:hypothetical protein
MFRRSFRGLVSLLFILVFLTQCQKASSPAPVTEKNSLPKISEKLPGTCPYPCTDLRCQAYSSGYCGTPPPPPIIVKTNANNPYDYVGSQHNNGLTTIYPNLSATDPNLDNDALAQDESYLSGLGYSSAAVGSFYNTASNDGLLPFSQIEELDSLGYVMVGMGLIDSQANYYVQQIYNFTTTYLGGNTVSTAQYNSYANSLISLESQIQSDGIISSNEKVTLLSISSIGRYSSAYWINFMNSQSSGQSAMSARVTSFSINLKKWFHNLSFFWKVTLSDVGGGLVGIIGGPLGIIGGAVGTSLVSAIQLAN